MATTTTYSLEKPTVGGDENTWGGDWNNNADKIDDLLDGTLAIKPNLDEGLWEVGGVAVTATAAALNTASTHYVPSGGIIMWSGSVGSIPSGWLLCDGTSGTPDLRDRFIVGAGNSYAVGATGGATTSTKTTSTSGSHDHGGTNSSSVTIGRDGWGTEGVALGSVTAGRLIVGSGQSEIGETLESLRGAGSDRTDGSHSHTINSDGSHNHSVTVDTVPPYYSLAYIMKA